VTLTSALLHRVSPFLPLCEVLAHAKKVWSLGYCGLVLLWRAQVRGALRRSCNGCRLVTMSSSPTCPRKRPALGAGLITRTIKSQVCVCDRLSASSSARPFFPARLRSARTLHQPCRRGRLRWDTTPKNNPFSGAALTPETPHCIGGQRFRSNPLLTLPGDLGAYAACL
jgi:hypothetical protein